MITPESFSELLGILGDKEKCIESDEFIYSKKTFRIFRTDARYFLFEARKETHEQRQTKIDIDEFRSGTTNITLLDRDACPITVTYSVAVSMQLQKFTRF